MAIVVCEGRAEEEIRISNRRRYAEKNQDRFFSAYLRRPAAVWYPDLGCLEMDPENQTIIGLDIGGTKTAVVEGSAQAEISQREEIATEAYRAFDEIFPRIAGLIKKTIEAARRSSREALAISVSIGGPLKIGEGVLIDPPHLPGWRGVRLKERLADEFPNLPVFVEHDGNATEPRRETCASGSWNAAREGLGVPLTRSRPLCQRSTIGSSR